MSYLSTTSGNGRLNTFRRERRLSRRGRAQALDGAASAFAERATPAIKAAGAILLDPALPEVSRLVLELRTLSKGSAFTPSERGVGLGRVVTPLRFYVYSRKHVWVLPAVIAGLLGLPFLLGYRLGKRRRKA